MVKYKGTIGEKTSSNRSDPYIMEGDRGRGSRNSRSPENTKRPGSSINRV